MLLDGLAVLLLLTSRADLSIRLQAGDELERALEQATVERGSPALAILEAGIETARATLGPDSEVANELARLACGAPLEGFLAGDDGAAWLARQLVQVVSDLRFEPVREAALPAGFPEPTPVGEIRVQRYPAYRLARTSLEGPDGDGAFWRLFGHIQQNQIAMTAPVETTLAGGVRAPSGTRMAFLYASPDLGTRVDGAGVEVIDVPPGIVVSIGMRGAETPERVATALVKLERWIDAHPGWRPSAAPRTMGHNGPAVRGDRRYFEVQMPVTRAEETVIDFTNPDEVRRWQAVDDVVMGGRSASRLIATSEGTAAFTGELSLENNGGFASVRTSGERCSLAGARSVSLRVRGDGRAYRLRLYTGTGRDVPGYQVTFPTRAGEWIDVTLQLADFRPTWRGRPVPGAPDLDPAAVVGMGLMIADGQEGPFRLELRSLTR